MAENMTPVTELLVYLRAKRASGEGRGGGRFAAIHQETTSGVLLGCASFRSWRESYLCHMDDCTFDLRVFQPVDVVFFLLSALGVRFLSF